MQPKSREKLFLLDVSPKSDILGSRLPSKKQVLSFMSYQITVLKRSKRESAVATLIKRRTFLDRIPTSRDDNIVKKVLSLYEEWKNLRFSSISRKNLVSQMAKEKAFRDGANNFFDIARQDALNTIVLKEDKEFLLAERATGRRGALVGIDIKLAHKEQRARKRAVDGEFRLNKEIKRIASLDEQIVEDKRDAYEDHINLPTSELTSSETPQNKRARRSLMNAEVPKALDRAKLSDRMATLVIASIVRSLGHNIEDYYISTDLRSRGIVSAYEKNKLENLESNSNLVES